MATFSGGKGDSLPPCHCLLVTPPPITRCDMIIWKTINRFPDYEISNEGVVRRAIGGRGAIKGKILRWHTHTSTGYPNVRFSVNGKQTAIPVHRLVAQTFLGNKQDGMQVRHLDGNKLNNHADNLCYGTAKENAQDKVLHGRSSKGIKNPKNKLTEQQVLSIRNLHGTVKARLVALIFGLNESTVYRIWSKKYWAFLPVEASNRAEGKATI